MKVTRTIYSKGLKPGWHTWIISAAIILFGLALLIWPGQTTGLILNFVGGLLMACGAFRLIRYFVKSRNTAVYNMDMGIGSTLFIIGLMIYIFKGFLLSIVPTIIGIILLISGLLKLQTALDFRRLNVRRWQLQLITSGISVVMGIIILINPFSTALLMTRIIGAAILIEGPQDTFSLRTFKDAYTTHYTYFIDE